MIKSVFIARHNVLDGNWIETEEHNLNCSINDICIAKSNFAVIVIMGAPQLRIGNELITYKFQYSIPYNI